MDKILILGATGNIGSAITRQFVKHGNPEKIIAGVRTPQKIIDTYQNQVATVPFDFSTPDCFDIFCKVTKVFLLAPPKGATQLPVFKSVLQKIKESGIEHLTFLSGRTTGDVIGYPLYEMEALVTSCGLPHTILRPGWFMQDFLVWWRKDIVEDGKINLPLKDYPISFVHLDDIGELGFLSLWECPSSLFNKTVSISGPQAQTMKQIADVFTKVLGRVITYHDLSPEDYYEHVTNNIGWPSKTAKFMNILFDLVKTGKERTVNLENEAILGRPLISFEEFVKENIENF